MNWQRFKEAKEFFKNEESEILLSMLIDYVIDYALSDREGDYDNMMAIHSILRERLEVH